MIEVITSSRYKVNRLLVKTVAQQLLLEKGFGENILLNVVFVGKKKMLTISREYKHEKDALPVLTFPYNESQENGNKLLGEIFICYPQAVLLAAERNRKVDDMILQLVHHGIDNLFK